METTGYELTGKQQRDIDEQIYEIAFNGQDLGYLEEGKVAIPYFSSCFFAMEILINELKYRPKLRTSNLIPKLKILSTSKGYTVSIEGTYVGKAEQLPLALAIAFLSYIRMN